MENKNKNNEKQSIKNKLKYSFLDIAFQRINFLSNVIFLITIFLI